MPGCTSAKSSALAGWGLIRKTQRDAGQATATRLLRSACPVVAVCLDASGTTCCLSPESLPALWPLLPSRWGMEAGPFAVRKDCFLRSLPSRGLTLGSLAGDCNSLLHKLLCTAPATCAHVLSGCLPACLRRYPPAPMLWNCPYCAPRARSLATREPFAGYPESTFLQLPSSQSASCGRS